MPFSQGAATKAQWNGLGVGTQAARKAVSAAGGVNFTAEGFGVVAAHRRKVKKCVSLMWSLSEGAFPVIQGWRHFWKKVFRFEGFTRFWNCYCSTWSTTIESWNGLFYFEITEGMEICYSPFQIKMSTACAVWQEGTVCSISMFILSVAATLMCRCQKLVRCITTNMHAFRWHR